MKSQMRRLAKAEIARNPPPPASPELVARISSLLNGNAPADYVGTAAVPRGRPVGAGARQRANLARAARRQVGLDYQSRADEAG